jgi:hypothetical protein
MSTDAGRIPDIYKYCDGWCERCRFRARCAHSLDSEACARAVATSHEALDRFFDEVFASPDDRMPHALHGTDVWLESLDRLNDTSADLSADDFERAIAESERHRALTEAHPLVTAASTYGELTRGVLAALDRIADALGDERVDLALDALDRHAAMISTKMLRAASCLVPAPLPRSPPDNGPHAAQSDANGSAKVVRLLIRESQQAWRTLMEPGRAMADGVPAAMIARLEAIDARVSAAFPSAMAFVRPGFD